MLGHNLGGIQSVVRFRQGMQSPVRHIPVFIRDGFFYIVRLIRPVPHAVGVEIKRPVSDTSVVVDIQEMLVGFLFGMIIALAFLIHTGTLKH